jgi:ribosomal protein S18 acetylase RimI-like enzyme
VIRPARAGDAAALAGVQLRAWWRAYGDYVDHDELAAHTVASRTERWREILAGGQTQTAVAEVDGRVTGFASVGVPVHADPEPGLGELHAIYVDPPAQGAGLGSALLADAEERLRAQGFSRALLCVFEANGLARAFYARHGWRDEDPPVVLHDRWAPEIRMLKQLRCWSPSPTTPRSASASGSAVASTLSARSPDASRGRGRRAARRPRPTAP